MILGKKTTRHRLLTLMGVSAISVATASAVSAAEVAEFYSLDGIEWQADEAYSGAKLVLLGPAGFYREQAFDASAALFLDFVALSDGYFPDGQYKYELVLSPAASKNTRALQSGSDGSAIGQEAAGRLAKSGTFQVSNGSIVDRDQTENLVKDILHNDDVIATFSMCIGNDCVNGESFGFDTLRLKENNIRIKFDDTSTSASFPSNDWQITANDSANGGANKFSIDDVSSGRTPFTVVAGAPNNALYVDAAGDLGLGTSTPVVDLHVVNGNTPTMRLEQDGSSGFTPQTWDVAGNEAGFFIRDVTNGSTLPFRIRPGAPSSAIDIAATGRVAVGNASPSVPLDVLASAATLGPGNVVAKFANPAGAVAVQLDAGDDGVGAWSISSLASDANFRINNAGGVGTELEINGTTGDITIVGTLTTGGGTCGGGCDQVFREDYALESIEQHANLMWRNGYLPNVGPTIENQPINLSDKTGRMLNELEKAHIYIEQLHRRLTELEAK